MSTKTYEQLRIEAAAAAQDGANVRISWVVAAVIVVSFYLSEITPSTFMSAAGWRAAGEFLSGLFPPEVSLDFLKLVGRAALETLAIAIAGLTLSIALGALAAPLASRAVVGRGWTMPVVRALLALVRSIPDLIWAVFFVRIVGLGPSAGVLAIGVSYGGILGKIYAELMDSAPKPPIEALESAGAGRFAQLIFAVIPLAWADLVGYSMYRWECAVRAAALLGIVGAGGLGQEIELSMRMFKYSEVTTMVLMLIMMVVAIDQMSGRIRKSA